MSHITDEAIGLYYDQTTEHLFNQSEETEFAKRVEARKLREATAIANANREELVGKEMYLEATEHFYGQCIKDLAQSEDDNRFLQNELNIADRTIDQQSKRISSYLETMRNQQDVIEVYETRDAAKAMAQAFSRVLNSRPYGFWGL